MLSAVIQSTHGYPAMPLARQLVHQRCLQPGPLVLRSEPLKYPTPTADRDQTVSRRFEPSSRTALIGEQPNPWDLLQPQDASFQYAAIYNDTHASDALIGCWDYGSALTLADGE